MRTSLHLMLVVGLVVGVVACDALTSRGLLEQITAPDESAVPDSVRQRYEEDAAQLAMRYVQEHRVLTETIELPEDRVQFFYRALLHVYSAQEVTSRDEVVGIHTFPRYNIRELIVAVDTTVSWTDAWQAGERLTGQSEVDALLEEYDLSVEYQSSSSQSYALVRSEAPLNTIALGKAFEEIEGVEYAEQNGYAGDGNNIEATVGEEAVVLAYSRGWGDCPAGCIHREAWTFRIEGDGTVRFVGHEER